MFTPITLSLLLFIFSGGQCLHAQPEVMAWGNMTGIRVDGQLMEFESTLRVVERGWRSFNATGRERQQPKYNREGVRQTVTTSIRDLSFTEVFQDCGKGCTSVTINTTARKDTLLEGVFFCIDLPRRYFADADIKFRKGSLGGKSTLKLTEIVPGNNQDPVKRTTGGLIIESSLRKLEITGNSTFLILIRREKENSGAQVYFELLGQKIKKGQESQKTFTIKADGVIDTSPAEIVLDVLNPGQKFDGFGGNFRLQNPKTDPQVIQYCLDNMRVAWGRVEMPWGLWHPAENTDPVGEAISGNLNPRVHAAMEMAQRLTRLGIPVILSDWSPPDWAVITDRRDAKGVQTKSMRGLPLNPEKTVKIYKSIGDYIWFMKQRYGVEAAMFSFNESDIGINVLQTGKEHAEFIKGLGSHLASRGLSTKLLLGDNSDASTFDFIIPAMNDPEAYRYIGAVSFHSWRGCTNERLKEWADAARKLNLPLIVAEGSTDAAAWNYPAIFSEYSFALNEINLYTRICKICQPLSILQWQLTADYSVLTGDGIFGTTGPLRPTQRFWNLKQLASTPEGSFAIPLSCNKETVNVAAFGNIARGEYAVHMVNNGAECRATLKGIPDGVRALEVMVTDNARGMEKTGVVNVINGMAEFTLAPAGFTTLISKIK